MHARMKPTRSSNDAPLAAAVRARALLIIEDDAPIRRARYTALGEVAERLLEAPTGKTGIDIAATERPDLVILDLGLPDLEGVAVCREIRSWSSVPIVVLSARHSDAEKVQLLNAGAGDYITKPFSTAEFVARVRAVLRRARSPGAADVPATVEAYGLMIDLVHPPARGTSCAHGWRTPDARSPISKSSRRCGERLPAVHSNTCGCTSRICAARSRRKPTGPTSY